MTEIAPFTIEYKVVGPGCQYLPDTLLTPESAVQHFLIHLDKLKPWIGDGTADIQIPAPHERFAGVMTGTSVEDCNRYLNDCMNQMFGDFGWGSSCGEHFENHWHYHVVAVTIYEELVPRRKPSREDFIKE